MPKKTHNDMKIRNNNIKIVELTNTIIKNEEILLEMHNSKNKAIIEFINNISYEDLVKEKVKNKLEIIQND